MLLNRTQIIPSIFAAHFPHIDKEIKKIKKSHIHIVHYDVMDNHFVPNISFGFDFIKQISTVMPNILSDIHLMIDLHNNWEKFLALDPYVLTIHLEAGDYKLITSILKKIKSAGILAGLSIKPSTPIDAIKEYVEYIDLLLIMTVEPGFSFQEFIPESISRIEEARKICGKEIIIEADGGINRNNMLQLKKAGLDWFVMGGGFFSDSKPSSLITDLDKIDNKNY